GGLLSHFPYHGPVERSVHEVDMDGDFAFIVDDGAGATQANRPVDADAAPLDAYSRAVVGVVDAVAPAVVHLQVAPGAHGGRGGPASGVVFTPDGLLLTNSHVVHQGSAVRATLNDGRTVPAYLVGEDPDTDLAVLRLHDGTPGWAKLGDSAAIRVGQLVVA